MEGRKWTALLLAIVGLLILQAAYAESDPVLDMLYDPYNQGTVTVTWRELNVSRDTNLPVFSAPYDDAWRGANGKACVNTNESFTLLGTVDGGEWGLVDYRVDDRSRRIGWIRMPEGSARASEYGDLWLARKLLRVTKNVTLTDDPMNGNREIRTIAAGEQVIGMFSFAEKGKVYVETRHEGKTVWGLIPIDAVEDMTDSLMSVEGNSLKIRDDVTMIGEISYDRYDPDTDRYLAVTHILPGDVDVGFLDLYTLSDKGVRNIELPESLRHIGMEGIAYGSLDEIRFSGNVDVCDDAFYAVRIGRIVLAGDYTGGIPDGSYLRVGEWQVEEGNPIYSDIDGVLFSADGKTLLRYPNDRPDEHYDVPAGTTEIAERAFSDNSMEIRLRSISLPPGLKKIGEYAFSDCGYLLSLAVPLTVTELASNAFRNCVSLERLSLPPGMTAVLSDWVKQEDYSSAFRGDNWGTYTKPEENNGWEPDYVESFRSYPVWLDNADGSGTVPVYASPTAETPSGTRPAGNMEDVYDVQNGRVSLGGDRWVNMENIRNSAGNIFFRITGGEPADPARRTAADGSILLYSGIWSGQVRFYHTADDGSYSEAEFPIRETVLYRERTGDGLKLGVIAPEGESAALLDAPGGTKVNHLYLETQAKVLEETEDWIRIETAYGTGWVAQEELVIVAEEPETAKR